MIGVAPQIIDQDFIEVLACPHCRGKLSAPLPNALRCNGCAAEFPVIDGIPILIVERKESLTQVESQRRIFDPQFEAYGSYVLENWRRSYLRRIGEQLRWQSGTTGPYVDVGAGGSGYTVIEAARLGHFAVGCDLSWAGMKKAAAFARSQGLEKRARFLVCGAETLPFQSQAFDTACEVAVLEHLVRDDVAVSELARILKPQGRVFVTVPHTFFRTNVMFWVPYWLHDRAHGHLRHYTARRLKRLFSGGFDDESVFFTGRTTKAAQMLAERLKIGGDALWWYLERLDLMNIHQPWGAQLHLSATRRLS